ncbi:MAG TPA: baseplate J/gp47 family protein, partial [Aggregatilineales bacterium]|nr:baseplate J/gp47 family protein [Aggregatilineales bacterium]
STRQQRLWFLGRLMVGLMVLLVMLGFLLAVIPSATITLTPASDAINEPIPIVANPALSDIDVLGSGVPAQVIRIVVQGDTVTVESSGRREAANARAEGRVTFSNESDNPLFIPAGTVVSADGNPPARFATTADAPLPPQAGSTVDVDVEALPDTAGLPGNVPADAINRVEGELEGIVSVRNPNPTFGGGLREDAVVTQADHDRLLTLARQAVQQAARNELLLQLPSDDKFLVPDSIRLVEERPEWMVYSAGVNDASESVSLEMRAAVEAVIVDQLQAQSLAFMKLSERLPPGREFNEKSLVYRREGIGVNAQGLYTFQMFVEGSTPFTIDSAAVADRVSVMSVSEAKRTLESELLLDPRHPPDIRLFPLDTGFMPLLPVRINVEINRDQ